MKLRSVFALALASVALISGCGGGQKSGGTDTTTAAPTAITNTRGMASARFTVVWPKTDSRVITADTNRITLYVAAVDMPQPVSVILNRPAAGGTTTVLLENIPAGRSRLFAAQAKRVANPVSTPEVNLTPTFDQLREGDTLTAGTAPVTDLRAGQMADITIDLSVPAVPPASLTQVDGVINQIVADAFPSVIAFEIFRDQSGKPITDLNASNFRVFEDGVECPVVDVRTAESSGTGINISLVLDRSGSMSGRAIEDLRNAATTFVSLLAAGDKANIVSFSSDTSLDQSLTEDKTLLTAAIAGIGASGGTALFDGIGFGLTTLESVRGRRAVIAMTDGQENASFSYDYNSVVQKALQVGAPVFTIGLGGSVDSGLADVANATGGVSFNAPDSAQLQTVYQAVSQQISSQVQIFFISPNPVRSGITRTVEIRLINYGSFSVTRTATYTM